jgi:isocitrate/isopropylmalate dehydrogenase
MRLAAFPGDGIGPEIVGESLEVIKSLARQFSLTLDIAVHPVGLAALDEYGSTFPEQSRRAACEADGIILGPLDTARYPTEIDGGVNASAKLRKDLDLYANIRPSRSLPGVPSAIASMDLIVVRENTEGFYACRAMHAGSGEFAPDPDTAFSLRRISAHCSRRIAERAFEIAGTRGRRVAAVHKANVLPLTDGIFLRECRAVSRQHPDVKYEELIVDAAAAKLVLGCHELDVLVTTNLFGDILSNEAAALTGGLGLAGSINHGDKHAMAQASHGAAPDIAGRGIANPASILFSTALLFEHLGRARSFRSLEDAGCSLRRAVEETVTNPDAHTPDLGGSATTKRFAQSVIQALPSSRVEQNEYLPRMSAGR